jgi:hypothetical protein
MTLGETIKKRLEEYEDYVIKCQELRVYPMPFEALTKAEKARVMALHFNSWRKQRMDVV